MLQLWEQGLVDLDVPANDYLRAYRLVPAKAAHRPATVRQLLTHTAGLPQLVYPSRAFRPILGETVRFGQRLPTLAEFYRGGLHLVAEPGTRHTYSNHGFATLGQIVEDVSGEPLDRWFRERIFDPLGLVDTDLLRSERVRSRLASGTQYELMGRVRSATGMSSRPPPDRSAKVSRPRPALPQPSPGPSAAEDAYPKSPVRCGRLRMRSSHASSDRQRPQPNRWRYARASSIGAARRSTSRLSTS